MNNLLFFSLYYSSSDPFSGFIGIVMIIFIGFICCRSLNDDNDSSTRTYGSRNYNRSFDFEDDENYMNWDDSWDDKWLHQGKYADNNNSHEEYTDYDPSWDEQFRH